jgi:hypothetical protein
MRRHLFAFLLLLLMADAASARILFDPPLVHENEAFDILIRSTSPNSSGPGAPYLRLAPGEITIDLMREQGALLTPAEWGERVRVDGMPAGTYDVVVRSNEQEWERTTLVVRPAPFTIAPSFAAVGTELLIEGVRPRCTTGPCTPVVRFGNEQATVIRITDEGGIIVETPSVLGRVDVTVRVGEFVYVLPGGFTGVLSGTNPDLAQMEKVLLPLNFRGDGAHGAEWHTETVVRSDAPIRVPTEPLIYFERLLPDLAGFTPLAPGVHVPFPEERVEGGVYFYVPRGLEKRLTWKSHILDRSRSATDRGTELPVVRVEDTSSVIRLMNVPLRSLFRARLRIYDFDTLENRDIGVLITKPDGTEVRRLLVTTHVPPCVTPPCTMYRAPFAAIDLSGIDGLGDAGEVDITIRAETNDARLWAFVSVSNNETQRVTLYTPQHDTPGATR